jgi:fumarate hydratase class II
MSETAANEDPTDAAAGDKATYRMEHDTMGDVRVPAEALWRAQTQRAVDNFTIGGGRMPLDIIHALALVKSAAARTNADLGVVDQGVAEAIAEAAEDIAAGHHDDQFPIDYLQTGSGTSTNMNVNEVISTLATRRLGHGVHPNDHVNASQSSNDTFPTAMHIAAALALTHQLVPALQHLQLAFLGAARDNVDVVKPGRTHLMDATPVTLAQELSGYAAQLGRGLDRLTSTLPRVLELALGGTAVGTGINVPADFVRLTLDRLNSSTGMSFLEAENHFEAQGARDALVELSGQLRVIAVSLIKICTDLRWMNSGPRAGLHEIVLPDLQPGSSIMPGKINPVVPEAVTMAAIQVIGNDTAVAFAGASGNFELNVTMPLIARNVLESIRLLSGSARLLADRAVTGLVADAVSSRTGAEASPAIVTALAPLLGYEATAQIAKAAIARRTSIRQAVLDGGYVDRGEIDLESLDRALDVTSMTNQ